MTYSSKRTVASIVMGLLVSAAYMIYAIFGNSPESGDLKSWAMTMLVFIGIGVVAAIMIEIIFYIAGTIGIAIREREQDEKKVQRTVSSLMLEDEMEKLIRLKSAHIGYIFAGVGFVAALVTISFDWSAVFALHMLFGSFVIGSIAEGVMKVYYYENGVRNG